jgi:hypothetical protein
MSNNVPIDNNYTCIVFLGDNSGSMANIDTCMLAESVNSIIKENQKRTDIIFYGATFSDTFNLFADGIIGSDVHITADQLIPDGMTALVPSFARMIRIVGSRLNTMTERKPSKVIFILLSDGEQTVPKLVNNDNDDKPYEGHNGIKNLRKLVEDHKNIWKWEFMFLGTNFDSIVTGGNFGIRREDCINYNYSSGGVQAVMRCASQNVSRKINGSSDGFLEEERTASMEPQ